AGCDRRRAARDSRPSVLTPLRFARSLGLGAGAGLMRARVSFGGGAATEQRVGAHRDRHLDDLPADDGASRAVVSQMLADEARHADKALAAGGLPCPAPAKGLMALVSKVMTSASYRL